MIVSVRYDSSGSSTRDYPNLNLSKTHVIDIRQDGKDYIGISVPQMWGAGGWEPITAATTYKITT